MRHVAIGLVIIGLAQTANAGQVCVNKKTNTLIEYQSRAEPGGCTKDALSAGVPAADIDERAVNDEEWKPLEHTYIIQPNEDLAAALRQDKQKKKDRLAAKLGLTASEFEELKDALR